jgi:hypothetical protein
MFHLASEEYVSVTETSKAVTKVIESDDPQVYVNKEVQGLGNYVPRTWDELVEYAAENYGEIIEIQGSPWEVVDKAQLVGVPFMIADVRAYFSDKFARDVVAVMLMTENALPDTRGNHYVINDGSTGIFEQITQMIRSTGRKVGISCSGGLRVSNYEYQETDLDGEPMLDSKGKPKPAIQASTYYIA